MKPLLPLLIYSTRLVPLSSKLQNVNLNFNVYDKYTNSMFVSHCFVYLFIYLCVYVSFNFAFEVFDGRYLSNLFLKYSPIDLEVCGYILLP